MCGVFAKSYIKHGLILKGNNMNFSYIENLGEGDFKITSLPIQVQTVPIFGMSVKYFNDDGNLDVLMVGNDLGNEV